MEDLKAIYIGGLWYIARLVLSEDYVTYHEGDEKRCWAEQHTTAFLGYETDAEVVIGLPEKYKKVRETDNG